MWESPSVLSMNAFGESVSLPSPQLRACDVPAYQEGGGLGMWESPSVLSMNAFGESVSLPSP